MLSRFDAVPERDGRTNGRTDRIPISMLRVSIAVLTCDKKIANIIATGILFH